MGTGQRAAAHCSSKTDNDEAFMAGQAAVKAAIEGETDKMVILVRAEGDAYSCETSLAPLSEIANGVKEIPQDWISEDGVSMTAKFIKYCQPLVQGEVEVPAQNGVPNMFACPIDAVRYWIPTNSNSIFSSKQPNSN